MRRREGDPILIRGHDALATFAGRHSRAPELFHKHLLIEPAIDVSYDGTAAATSYFAVLQEDDGRPRLRNFGRYRDRLERGADGVWRFAHRVAEVEVADALPPLRRTLPSGGR